MACYDSGIVTPKPSMSMDRMRIIDHWLGVPLCVLLGALARIFPGLFSRRRDVAAPPRRIVVMKFFGLGSVVLAGPMLRAIRDRYPETTLVFLTFDPTVRLIERMKVCDEIWALRTDTLFGFCADVLQQLVRFVRTPVDVCIDLEFFSKFSTLMSVLSRAPVRVAFHLNSFWRYSAVTHPIYYNYYRHVSEVYNDAAAAIGAPVSDTRPCRIAVTPDEVEAVRRKLVAAGWNGFERLVGINVNAGELAFERRWPRERFAVIVERLVANEGLRVVLTGAPNEREYVAGLLAVLPQGVRAKVINMAGELSFDEFIASFELYDFFLTNDSGPVQMAYQQGADTISLWGVGRPSFYGPLHGTHSTLYRQLPCSPCLYMFTSQVGQWCDHRADCLRAIGEEEVWSAVKRFLDTPRAERGKVVVKEGW